MRVALGTVSQDFLLRVFSMNRLPPSPWKKLWDLFKFFRQFAEIFASQGVNNTGGKFAASVNDAVATGINDTSGNLANLPTTPMVHLEPRIPTRIFEKIQNGRNVMCLGETDSW